MKLSRPSGLSLLTVALLVLLPSLAVLQYRKDLAMSFDEYHR